MEFPHRNSHVMCLRKLNVTLCISCICTRWKPLFHVPQLEAVLYFMQSQGTQPMISCIHMRNSPRKFVSTLEEEQDDMYSYWRIPFYHILVWKILHYISIFGSMNVIVPYKLTASGNIR